VVPPPPRRAPADDERAHAHRPQALPVKNNTAYCFGIDDYEFILSFEAESPEKFQDLMMELRESEASSYTDLDTPIFTCRRRTLTEIVEALG
jgi:chlorite dismutase